MESLNLLFVIKAFFRQLHY